MDVAVIIPAHNASRTLAAAVHSAREQRLQPAQILVVADRCEDQTAQVARDAGAQVHEIDRGSAAAARNHGASFSRVPWLAFLDADDRWEPSWLHAVAATAKQVPRASVLYGAAHPWFPSPGETPRNPRQPIAGDAFERLLIDCFMITSATVVRKDAFDRAGGFDETHRGAGVEDYDLWLRLGSCETLAAVSGVHVHYGRDALGSIRDPSQFATHLRETLRALEHAMEQRRVPSHLRARAQANARRMSAERRLAAGQTLAGVRDLVAAIRRWPWDPRYLELLVAAGLPPPLRERLRRARQSLKAARGGIFPP